MKYWRRGSIPLGKLGSAIILGVICITLASCGVWGGGAADYPVTSAATGGRPVVNDETPTSEKIVSVIWDDAQYGFVRIVEAEPGAAPNDQPVNLPRREIAAVLGELELEGSKKPIFTEPEIKDLAKPLAEALAAAGPAQDITFASTGRRWGQLSILVPRVLNTGRVFYRDGQLNIIFGIIHGEFEGQLRATGILRPFTPGSRQRQLEQDWVVMPSKDLRYATTERADWVRIAAVPGEVTQAAVTETQPIGLHTEPAAGAPRPVVASPSVTGSGVQQRPGTQSGTNSAYSGSAQRYQDVEDRLKGLKRLREQNLITEKEYQAKRRTLLDQL